jgi:hypothetical protein
MAIVILYDIDEIEVATWTRQNCPSLSSWLVYENNPLWGDPGENDPWFARYEFEFGDEQEAMLFQLRWDGQ